MTGAERTTHSSEIIREVSIMGVDNGFHNKYFEEVIKEVAAGKGIKDVKIVFENGVETGINFLGIIHRFTVEGVRDGERVQLHMIGKVITDSEVKREVMPLNTFAKREYHMYDVIFRELDTIVKEDNRDVAINRPLCYRACADMYKEIILMEDLTAKGYEQCRIGKILDYNHTFLVLEQLARYHAQSFVYKEKFPEKYTKMAESLTDMLYTQLESIEVSVMAALKYARKHAECDGSKEVLEALQRHDIVERTRFLLDGRNEEYSVICHGDLWTNNLMFRYKDYKPMDVMLLDWQCIRYSSPVTDLFFVIFISVCKDLRQKSFQKLLEFYYESLKTKIIALKGNPEVLYPEKVFREHLTKYSYTGLSSALIMLTIFNGAGMPAEEDMQEYFKKHGTVISGDQPSETYVKQMTRTFEDIKENNLHTLWCIGA